MVITRVHQRGVKSASAATDHAGDFEYVLDFRFEAHQSHCYWCGSPELKEKLESVEVRDLPLHGRATWLRGRLPKYECGHCGRVFSTRCLGIDGRRRMTIRLLEHLEDRVLQRRHNELALDYRVSEGTLRTIRDELVSAIEAAWVVRTPRVLGIDDVNIHGTARTIFIDSETGEILFLADSKEAADVVPALQLFAAGGPPEVVTADMDVTYLAMIRAHLPNTRIVFDKFHVAQRANKMMRDVRRAWQRAKAGSASLLQPMEKRAFDYRQHNLPTRKGDLLDKTWLPNIPLLLEAYKLKEEFLQILDLSSQQSAEAAFAAWQATVEAWVSSEELKALDTKAAAEIAGAFRSLITLVTENLDETFGGLAEGLNNARTENANGKIRAIEGIGQGFSYAVLKDRILYGHLVPSVDLHQCDICGKRSVHRPLEGLDVGGSWTSQNPKLRVRQQFCDPCWAEYIGMRHSLGDKGLPVDQQLGSLPSEPPIRARLRARARAQRDIRKRPIAAKAGLTQQPIVRSQKESPTISMGSPEGCGRPEYHQATQSTSAIRRSRGKEKRELAVQPLLPNLTAREPDA